MPNSRTRYPVDFRHQVIELARAGGGVGIFVCEPG